MLSGCKIVLLLFGHFVINVCQQIGAPCQVAHSGEPGICRIHSDCPGIDELARRNLRIRLCGFYDSIRPIVCCREYVQFHQAPASDAIAFPTDSFSNFQRNPFLNAAPRKSEQKCLEYTKDLTEVVHALSLTADAIPYSINVTKCNYNSVSLIVGGSPANPGEFPFMAAIGFPDPDTNQPSWRCGGTLISDRWVLTAAHCTYTRDDLNPRWIRLGATNLNHPEERGRKDYDVNQILVHPDYKYNQKYNDIALISTTRTVQFSKYIRPACLFTKPTIQENSVLAAGWGQIEFLGSSSPKLLKVNLNVYESSVCAGAYNNEIVNGQQLSRGVVRSQLCAGEIKGGKDTCLGDSGGPLFVSEKGNMCKFYVVGVTSFGKLCAQEGIPGVYTRVSEYVDWIERTIW